MSRVATRTTTARAGPAATPEPVLPQTFTDGRPLPQLMIFDLDFTLWPMWVDTHADPPLRASKRSPGREAIDNCGNSLRFYEEVPDLLAACKKQGIQVAAASRTHTPQLARRMLELLHVFDKNEASSGRARAGDSTGGSSPAIGYFASLQIYPGSKVRHMECIRSELGVPYSEMLFFDDESRNREVERELGVCFQLVNNGVTTHEVDLAVNKWRKARGHD